MRRLLSSFLLLVVCGCSGPVSTSAPVPAATAVLVSTPAPATAGGDLAQIKKAVFSEGLLWLVSVTGRLSHVADGGTEEIAEPMASRVMDICIQNGRPVIISNPRMGANIWTLSQRVDGAWVELAKGRQAAKVLAMDCRGGGVTLLAGDQLIQVEGGKQSVIPLQGELYNARMPGRVSAVHLHASDLYVAFDAGEWGGGLQRIDIRTGVIRQVRQNASDEGCTEREGSPCDWDNTVRGPVQAIATSPFDPDCVVVALGLVHFTSRGAVMEVCGGRIRQFYSHAIPPEDMNASVSFYGLVSAGDVLWAAGIDGLYSLTRDGKAQIRPWPTMNRVGSVAVSFQMPAFVVVGTDVNRAMAMGGATPLLVPR